MARGIDQPARGGRLTQTPRNYVSVALGRLRRAVVGACMLLASALSVQVLVWALAMYTDLRYESVESGDAPPTIVQGDHKSRPGVRPSAANVGSLRKPAAVDEDGMPISEGDRGDAQRAEADESGASEAPMFADALATATDTKLSAMDRHFSRAMSLSAAAGTMAMLLLIPLLAVGVMLGAGSATPGVEKTVSAMTWAMAVAMMSLPLSSLFPLIGFDGAIGDYPSMMTAVEQARDDEQTVLRELSGTAASTSGGGPLFYGRFFLLPMTCVVGTVLVGLKFSAGVEAAMIPLDFRLDPALEKEAANVKASTLHGGGRNAVALRGMLGPERRGSVEPDPQPVAEPPPATKLSPGTAPRRII
jgi:hypothetical protein